MPWVRFALPTRLSMPAFNWRLSDQQIADLINYIRGAWGNSAPAMSKSQVKDLRKTVRNASNER